MVSFLKREKEIFLQTYNRIPLDISHGDGIHLITKDGTKYLDFFSGLGVNVLGHAHPVIVRAIQRQAERFAHISNSFITDVQIDFSDYLLKLSNMSRIFLTNSGTEAVEAAIKVVRKIKGGDKKIYSLTNSFHGRTYGSLSLTDKAKYKSGFEPLLQNIATIKFNDVKDLEYKINDDTAAVFLEFIQGEGGINVVSNEFVSALQKISNKFDFITVADCIQSGIGRTGKTFAFNHFNFIPDLILTAKSIGGGLPLGALLVNDKYKNVFTFGSHGSTFGGNPISCAAGLAVLKEVFENGLFEKVSEFGSYLKLQLTELQSMYPELITDVRGYGFMLGVEFHNECKNIVQSLFNKKILSNCTNGNVLRLLPPFIIEKSEIDFFLYGLHESLKENS